MEAQWGPTPYFLPRKAETPSPQNTQGPPRGAGERLGCVEGREPDLGVSQNEICSPSQLQRASERRGPLGKEPPNIMLYRGPSTLEAPGPWRRSEENGGVPITFWEPWGVLIPQLAGEQAASPASFSSKGQMCSQQLAVATPSRELPSRRCRGLLACSCRLAGGGEGDGGK